MQESTPNQPEIEDGTERDMSPGQLFEVAGPETSVSWDEALSLKAAAVALGIPLATMKKRVQRGKYPAIRREDGWYVVISQEGIGTSGTGQGQDRPGTVPGQKDGTSKGQSAGTNTGTPSGQVASVPGQAETIAGLQGEIVRLEQTVRILEDQLATKDDQIAMLIQYQPLRGLGPGDGRVIDVSATDRPQTVQNAPGRAEAPAEGQASSGGASGLIDRIRKAVGFGG